MPPRINKKAQRGALSQVCGRIGEAVLLALGWALIWRSGDTDEAIEEESTAIKLSPLDAKADFGWGCLGGQGNLCGALKQYQIADTLSSDSDAKINYERLANAHLNGPPE